MHAASCALLRRGMRTKNVSLPVATGVGGPMNRACPLWIRRPLSAGRPTAASAAVPLFKHFDAVVFDKDGTLVDFSKTWDPAVDGTIHSEAWTGGDVAKQEAIAGALGFDLGTRSCMMGAPVVHVANSELARLLDPLVGGRGLEFMADVGVLVVENVTQVRDARAVLRALDEAAIPTAIATNDDEVPSMKQLDKLGWTFGAVLGCDSGFGGKPAPGMLLEAARRLGVPPGRCAMVGDAASDLEAAKAAGFAAAILIGSPDVVGQHADQADYWITDLSGLLRRSCEASVEAVQAAH